MTKEQLKQELKEKVKEGVKPSDIRKLKRSKSLGDIPLTLNKGSGTSFLSAPPLPNQPCLKCDELQKQLDKANQDWLNLAQKQTDNLKATPNPRIKDLEKELNQTVADATDEITRQENEIKQLRTKLTQTNNQNQDLTKQITNYERAAEFRLNNPFQEKAPNYSTFWEDYGLIILLLGTYCLSTWMLSKNYPERSL